MRPQTIVERLDFVAKRIPGLKFTPPTQLKPGDEFNGCFMSCDMYYIEIKVDQSHQNVTDVVICHLNQVETPCPILTKVLQDQDFETFAKHLTGLHSIYQITTNDKKVKQKAYPALTALETDLTIVYDHTRRRTNNCHDLIHKSPIGIMEPRKGGLPIRLTFFITPYDQVDLVNKGLINLTINNIIDKNLGLSATVEIEGSSTHRLQIKSLISTQSSLPSFGHLQPQNSEKLPAQFVLKLSRPLPMLNTSIHQIINEINEPTTIKEYLTSLTEKSKKSLISLIARQELDLNKGRFGRSADSSKSDSDSCDSQKHVYSIKLLDQNHTYHILDSYLESQDGVYLEKLPFTHPTSIPLILRVLRQQALFNFVIGSCIRRNKSNIDTSLDENGLKNFQETHIFDVIPVNLNNVCISFEHPSKESLATLEIDFKELSCQLYALDKESVCSNEFATKVLQKCWSIPITLRSVLKKCNERRLEILEDAKKKNFRGIQELLTDSSTQPGIQYKSHLQYQEALLQSKFNSLNDKSTRDLNSMAEFLSSKMTNASTSDASNQTNNLSNVDTINSRSNLLKKFSCKPKAKQSTITKNQTGNKILSQMLLKRQSSSTSSVEDAHLKATLTKKVKTKNLQSDSGSKGPSTGITTTKLISPEVATAARFANKQAKQSGSNQNSLIRLPSKAQTSIITSSSAPTISVGVSLTSQAGSAVSGSKQQFESSILNSGSMNSGNIRVKTQSNGNNNTVGKPRKSSIGAVLDKLVGGVTPEQNSSSSSSVNNLGFSNDCTASDSGVKIADSSKGSPQGAKSKSRTPGDQFAIKQGSLGGLKLTVTKTKPATAVTASSTSTSSSSSSSSTTSSSTSAPTTTFSSSTSSTTNNSSSPANARNSDPSKILGLGSSTTNTKYTIPKISKTQQASQSGPNSQANSTDSSSGVASDSNSLQGDDSTNPSSSVIVPSSTTTIKRVTATPFNRTNSSNRNPVSSSTHPLGRTTSNPLANASSRPSSTIINDNHLLSRISSSNQSQQNMRQQMNNRMVSLQHQQQQQQAAQRNLNPIQNQQQLPSAQPSQTPMFALGLNQQQGVSFQTTPDISILASNQGVPLNQQRNQANLNSMQQLPGSSFMSSPVDANLISSSRPHFAVAMQQQQQQSQQPQHVPVIPTVSSINSGNICDSLPRPSTSVINAPPQYYIRQPMFEETSNAVSSTPRSANEASQSSFLDPRKLIDSGMPSAQHHPTASTLPMSFQPRIIESQRVGTAITTNNETSSSAISVQTQILSGNPGVSSSSDSGSRDCAQTISTPSSPTECGHTETVPPPPLIPIDSLDEPQATSPDTDHPDDASDRLSIADTNENIADSNSLVGTPKPSSVNSPLNTQDSNSAAPSSSSRSVDSGIISSVNCEQTSIQSASSSAISASTNNELMGVVQSPVELTTSTSTSTTTTTNPNPLNATGSVERLITGLPQSSSSSIATLDKCPEGPSLSQIQSTSSDSTAPNESDQIAPQSTMAATTSEM